MDQRPMRRRLPQDWRSEWEWGLRQLRDRLAEEARANAERDADLHREELIWQSAVDWTASSAGEEFFGRVVASTQKNLAVEDSDGKIWRFERPDPPYFSTGPRIKEPIGRLVTVVPHPHRGYRVVMGGFVRPRSTQIDTSIGSP